MSRELIDSGVKWIGKIPTSWKIRKINKIFFRRKEINTDDNPVILSLARDGIKIRDITSNEGQLAQSYDNYHKVYKNDLLLNPMDLISGANCNLSYIEGVISPAYMNLAAKIECCPKYYDYFFKNQYWIKAMFIHGKGVSFDNRWTLNYETLMNYKVPFPPKEEQIKIANYIDKKISKIDQTIEDNKKEIELLEEYKKNFIAEIILKNGVDITNTIDFNKQWITSVSRDTKIIPLKFLSRLQTGTTPKKFEKNVTEKKIEWFTPGDFKRLELNNSSRKLDCDLIEGTKMFPKGATLIIGIGGTLGKIGFIVEQAYSNQQITAVIPNDNKILPKYLTYNLISAMNYIKDTTPYTTLPILSNSYLNNILICNRNLKEQNNILNKIELNKSKINNIIKYRQQIIYKLEEYKKSLIYEVVTGKIEV